MTGTANAQSAAQREQIADAMVATNDHRIGLLYRLLRSLLRHHSVTHLEELRVGPNLYGY